MRSEPSLSDPAEARRQEILAAAFEVFRQYGFRRSSMEDIARAAGLSRAALYLHYRNKSDIFRSLAEAYFVQTEHRIRDALIEAAPVEAALKAVFAAKAGPEMEALLDSPHGDELLDANFAVCGDIVQDGEARIAAVLADWLNLEALAGRVTLEPTGGDALPLARTMIGALVGQKSASAGFSAYRDACDRLAVMFARGLRP
jgi:AcrR family transcriptional regulator